TDSTAHKRVKALRELMKLLRRYEINPHPAFAFEIGKAEMLLRALMESEQVRLGQINKHSQKKASAKGGMESAAARREASADGHKEYAALYHELRKSHTKWTEDQCYAWIAQEHGERVAREYPGCGKSKGTVRRAVL